MISHMLPILRGSGLMPAGGTRGSPSKSSKSRIPCYDPGTMELLGYAPAMTPSQVSSYGVCGE